MNDKTNDKDFYKSIFLWQAGKVTLSDVYKAARKASKDNHIAHELLASLDSVYNEMKKGE